MTARALAATPGGLAIAVAVVGFAAYRAARLIALDSITEGIRTAVLRFAYRFTEDDDYQAKARWRHYLYELLTCPHCLGVWATAGIVAAWWTTPWVTPIVIVAAAAGAQSMLTSTIGD